MKLADRVFRTITISCFFIFLHQNILGQLSLQQTNWTSHLKPGDGKKTDLQFSNDSLLIKKKGNEIIYAVLYKQKGDTLFVYNSPGNGNCPDDTGSYRAAYSHSGQFLSLHMIRDKCNERSGLLNSKAPLSFIPADGIATRDWLGLDPSSDSIAGISLYKAYELLKGRISKQVIVAVIDNGVDIVHEDLKNIIWTNTKEIPGNGIDDDHNGYVDDTHGWNFRGAKDGTIIENEQAGATQVYSAWKDKYDKADTTRLNQDEKKKWIIFKRARQEYFEKIKESKDPDELKFAYNIKYRSSELIYNDSANSTNHYYGSPVIKLSSNLSHGTHVAGIIGAIRNNQVGIDGVAGNVRIMPVVASTAVGDERDKDVANAIRYAVNNGAQVINISFSKVYSPDKNIVDEAIRYAEIKNVLIIHCAGNDGVNIDSVNNYHYPVAIYENGKKASNFITVARSRPKFDYRLAHPLSGYGKKNTDVFAPGSDIFSTVPGNGYDFKSGSSMSVPCVSGVAALLLAYFPALSTRQVREIILRSAFKPGILVNRPGTTIKVPFNSLSASGGIINAYNAVKLAIAMTKKN